MGPRRSGFDFECGAFRSDLILNKFKRMGLIRCLILNVTIVYLYTHCNMTWLVCA